MVECFFFGSSWEALSIKLWAKLESSFEQQYQVNLKFM